MSTDSLPAENNRFQPDAVLEAGVFHPAADPVPLAVQDQRQAHQHQVERPRAAQPHHADGDRDHQRGRAEVRLRKQQQHDHAGDQHRLEQAQEFRFHIFAVAHQVAGDVDHQNEFYRLDRLERGHQQVQPAPRAVDAHAEVRHEHRQQQQERHRQQRERILFQQLQLGAHRQAGREQTQAEEQQVLLQEIERADVLAVRHRDRARRHHHHAHAGQPDQRNQQPQVEAAARSAAAFGLGGGVEDRHQRTFNVARPTSTSTTEMIQKRTITRGSGQPFNSKW